MKNLFIIILFLFGTSVLADTTEVELKEARTLVTATQKVSISSEIAARVEKINFLMGDAFKKGDVLISFDCKLYNDRSEKRQWIKCREFIVFFTLKFEI